jgi:hypothetical protein
VGNRFGVDLYDFVVFSGGWSRVDRKKGKNFFLHNVVWGNFFLAEPKYDILYTNGFHSSRATIEQAGLSAHAPKNARYDRWKIFGVSTMSYLANFPKNFKQQLTDFFTRTTKGHVWAGPFYIF